VKEGREVGMIGRDKMVGVGGKTGGVRDQPNEK